jgi:hypothetical protein
MGILSDILNDVGAEMGRLGTQGQMELASAIFNGNAFVPYGPGQYTPSAEQTVEAPVVEQPAIQEQSRGMEM